MENSLSPQKESLVSSFLEIAVGQTTDTALQFLKAANWQLEEAIQLFYVGNEGGGAPPSTSSSDDATVVESPWSNENMVANDSLVQATTEDEVRAPLPVRREVLYDDAAIFRNNPSAVVAFHNFAQESRRADIWENDQGDASTASSSRDNLATLYQPPFALMHQGSFDKVKVDASFEDKWLLVNLQSAEEFSSHMLNRDTWSNEAVAQTIRSNFIFWQVYHDASEGKKVCTYYNLYSMPAILVIDPITGQKMHAWSGMVQPDRLLEDLLPYMDRGPKEHHVALPYKRHRESDTSKSSPPPGLYEDEEIRLAIAASLKETKDTTVAKDSEKPKKEGEKEAKSSTNTPSYPPLPEEPKTCKDLTCRVGIRLPDGRRIQRHFLLTDSTELLWSFCSSQLEEAKTRLFSFAQAIPGSSKSIKYEDKLNFKESGLANSMIALTWE